MTDNFICEVYLCKRKRKYSLKKRQSFIKQAVLKIHYHVFLGELHYTIFLVLE